MLRISHDPKAHQKGSWMWQWCIVQQTLNDPRLRLGLLTLVLIHGSLFLLLGVAIGYRLPRPAESIEVRHA